MTPSQQVITHMKQLGDEQAAEFYGKSVSAIRTAINTKNISGKLIDKYFESKNPDPKLEAPQPAVFNATYSTSQSDFNARIQSLESDMEEIKGILATRAVNQIAAGQPIAGPLHQPPRPVNAPPVVQGQRSTGAGSFDAQGIAPSAADANSEGGQGALAGPAEHMHLQSDGRRQDWSYTAQELKAIREGRMKRA